MTEVTIYYISKINYVKTRNFLFRFLNNFSTVDRAF